MILYHMREVTRIYGRLYREPVVETEEETEADEKEELNNSVKDDKIKKYLFFASERRSRWRNRQAV